MSYFSRVTLNLGRAKPEQLAALACGDRYREHQALWRLFASDPDAERDFLFRRNEHNQALSYYVVSKRPPEDHDGIWSIESKDYAPKIRAGERFAFSLRANPVIRRKGEDGKSKRHDVVMDLKRQCGYQSQSRAERKAEGELIQIAGSKWLQSRAEKHGFSVSEKAIRIEGYHQHRSSRAGRQITFSTLDITGVLRVESPGLFTQALQAGIGPAKAFGCGLMLVRRL